MCVLFSKQMPSNKKQTNKQKFLDKTQTYNNLSSLPPVVFLHQVGDDEESCPVVAMGTVNTCSTHRYAYIDRILYRNIIFAVMRGRACGVMLFIAIRTSELATISAEAEDTDEIFGTVYKLSYNLSKI